MKFIILALLIVIVLLIIIIGKNKKKPYITKTRISLLDSEVRLFSSYIEKHYADPHLTISRACEELHTSVSFVETLFEKELGISAQTFLEKVRLHHFLESHGDTLTDEIIEKYAPNYGFTDSIAFNECYKRIYPQMPS